MLEVVEEEQQPLVSDVLGEAVLGAEGMPGGSEHELRVTERSERNPPDAVRIVGRRDPGCLCREPRLPGTARSGEGEQANVIA